MEKIANKLRESVETAARKRLGQNSLTQHEREDIEKRTALEYAKENNLWIDSLYSLGKPTKISGYENTLALDDKNGVIYKSNNLFNSGFLISTLFQKLKFTIFFFRKQNINLLGLQA